MKRATVVFPVGWVFSFNVIGKEVAVVEKDAMDILRKNGIRVFKPESHSYSLGIPKDKEKDLLDAEFIDNLRKTGLTIEIE